MGATLLLGKPENLDVLRAACLLSPQPRRECHSRPQHDKGVGCSSGGLQPTRRGEKQAGVRLNHGGVSVQIGPRGGPRGKYCH